MQGASWAHFQGLAVSPHIAITRKKKSSNVQPGSFRTYPSSFREREGESTLTWWTCNAIALPSEHSAWWELMPDSCPVLLCHSNLLPSEVLSQRAPDSLADNSDRAAGLTRNLAFWCISQWSHLKVRTTSSNTTYSALSKRERERTCVMTDVLMKSTFRRNSNAVVVRGALLFLHSRSVC